jgi:hypothetical protein
MINKFKKLVDAHIKGDDVLQEAVETVKSIIDVGDITFNPDAMKPESIGLLRESLKHIECKSIKVIAPYAEAIYNGRIKELNIVESINKNFMVLEDDNLIYGFVRFRIPNSPAAVDVSSESVKEAIRIRDFIKFDKPILKQDVKESFIRKAIPKDKDFSKVDNLDELHSKIHAFTIVESITTGTRPENWQIELHRQIKDAMDAKSVSHFSCSELDHLSENLKIDELITLKTIIEKLGNVSIRRPILSIVGESVKSGIFDTIDFNLNWPSWDTKFIALVDKRIREALPQNLKYRINLNVDDDGGLVDIMPLCDMSLTINIGEAYKSKLGELKKARDNE